MFNNLAQLLYSLPSGFDWPLLGILFFAAGYGAAPFIRRVKMIRERRNLPIHQPFDNVDILELFPFPVKLVAPDGFVSQNARFTRHQDALAAAEHTDVLLLNNKSSDWFTYTQHDHNGVKLALALPANAQVNSEAALSRLMETLSTIFSELPTGLAIFDANGRLMVFNPALGDLLRLDPVWLAARPTLAEILNRLRDKNGLPARKDFLEWRKRLTRMTASGNIGLFDDRWETADGPVLHVKGQAHKKGGTVFVFDDITAEIAARRFGNGEKAVTTAILESIGQPVAIFSQAGQITFANIAFKIDCGIGSDNFDSVVDCVNTTRSHGKNGNYNEIIDTIRRHTSQSEVRKPATIALAHPEHATLHLFPLPNGNTLVTLDKTNLAKALVTKIPACLTHEPVMISNMNGNNTMSSSLSMTGLGEFLARRKITLTTSGFDALPTASTTSVHVRRILWYLVLATSNLCRDNGEVMLTAEHNGAALIIRCQVPDEDVLTNHSSHLSLGLLRQLVDQAGADADWVFDETARPLTISCLIPITKHSEQVAPNPTSSLSVG